MKWEKLAKKYAKGFKNGDLTQKGMGLTDSEAVRLRNMMRDEIYEGTMPFFICYKVYSLCVEFEKIIETINESKNYEDIPKIGSIYLEYLKINSAVAFCFNIHKLRLSLPTILDS